ncbi:oligosaccharide flippase family protein [uncultured Litoreibacter sp.]|uniref:oligosaccharide flippase family protein n=1 Tax=uncultured Litoreibacter sp. TaxID=1392394 RepID=UPI00261A87BD|nr:oligosaccharide flippase family protein [uncultured Litoreibacter sp.]
MNRIATLLTGNGLSAAFTLARNLVLAHMLGPAHYGMAIAIVILAAAAEMLTTLGLPHLMISGKGGAARRFQSDLHFLQMTRGIAGAVIIVTCASPLAQAFGNPEFAATLQLAALIPFTLGFIHLDHFRAQRHQHHLPQILVHTIPAALSFALIWPLSWLQGSLNIMLQVLLLQACTTVAVSHLVSTRAYRITLSQSSLRRALRFGLPLAVNGVMMFAVLHSEKLVAGARLGMSDMGLLAMGITLTLTPALISARSFQAYHLPKLRAGGGSIIGVSLLLAASLASGVAALAPMIVSWLGVQFLPVVGLIPILSCTAAMRLPKSALATAALANANTSFPALANLPRLLAIPVMWWALSYGGGLEAILVIAFAAEVSGCVIGAYVARTFVPLAELVIALAAISMVLSGQILFASMVCILGWGICSPKLALWTRTA